jgi:dCTP deaminase
VFLSGSVIVELVEKTRLLKERGLLDLNGIHANEELIDIEPYRPEQVNPNSYNLRLGSELLTYDLAIDSKTRPTRPPQELIYEVGVGGNWQHALDCARDNPVKRHVIPPEGFVLLPDVLYLGCTEEYTEIYNLVPDIEGRSSVGRLGLTVHQTAGFGETFFRGQWTVEMTVTHPLRVYAGMQFCQLVIGELRGRDRRNRYDGKYQNQRGPQPSRLWKEFPQPGG